MTTMTEQVRMIGDIRVIESPRTSDASCGRCGDGFYYVGLRASEWGRYWARRHVCLGDS